MWKAATESEPFREFLKDPSIPKPDKQAALDGILGKMGVSDLTKNFFSTPCNARLSSKQCPHGSEGAKEPRL